MTDQSGSSRSPPFTSRLLPTAEEEVPPEVAAAVRAVCRDMPEIERGFICWIEDTAASGETRHRLSFAAKLAWPVSSPEDTAGVGLAIIKQLGERDRELSGSLAASVLADRAVPAWDAHAVCLFTRS